MLLDSANLLSGCPADLCPRADQVVGNYTLATSAIAVTGAPRPGAAQLAGSDPDGGARPVCGRPGLAGQGARPAAASRRLAGYLPSCGDRSRAWHSGTCVVALGETLL